MSEAQRKINRERVKASRDRKIAEIGEVAYKAQEKVKREARRTVQKAFESKVQESVDKINGVEPEILKKQANVQCKKNLLDKLYKLKKAHYEALSPPKTIKKASVDIQLTKLTNLRKNITGIDDCNELDFSFLSDTKNVLNYIDSNYHTLKSRNSQIQGIASILQILPGSDKLYKFYSKISVDRQVGITVNTDENTLSAKEKLNMLPWKDIKKIYKKVADDYHKALIGIYVLIPPRRDMDYSQMTVINKEPDDTEFNYLVVDKHNIPSKMIFNVYKTAKFYGQQVIKVPKTLQTVLKKYIDLYQVKNNKPLFPTHGGTHYKKISELISNIFKLYSDKHITINGLRHSYISDFLAKNPSTAQKKKVATAMANSILVQMDYNKIDL